MTTVVDTNNQCIDELNALRMEVEQLKTTLSDSYELGEIGSCTVDMVTGEVTWCKRIRSLFEIHDDELPPRSIGTFIPFVHREDRHILMNDWRALTSQAKVFTRKFRITTRSGKLRHIRSIVKSVFLGDRLIKVQGMYKDIPSVATLDDNNILERLSSNLFKDNELTWVGEYEIDMRTDRWILSKSLQSILEIDYEQVPQTTSEFINLCVAPDDRDMVIALVNEIRNQAPTVTQYQIAPNAFQLEYRVMTLRTLQIKHVISRYINTYENGRVIKINGLIVDVTLTKKYEKDLLKSREQFKLLFDNMRQGVSFHDKDGKIINFNAAAQQITGFTRSEYMHKYPFELNIKVLREDGTEMPQEEQPVLQTIRFGIAVSNVIIGIVNPMNHITKWLRISLIPIRSALSDQEGFFSLFEDISDSKRSFELLQKTNEQLSESLQQLIRKNKTIKQANSKLTKTRSELGYALRQLELKTNTLNQMVLLMVSDSRGNIVEVNDRFLEVLGYEQSELVGQSFFLQPDNMFHSGVHSPEYYAHRRAIVFQGKVWRGEICKKTKSGKLIWFLQTIMPIKNDAGRIERIYFYNSEITQLKRREKAIRHEKRIAEEAIHIKEEFLSMMSHEVRTPLNSLIGLISLLQRRNPREDQMEIVQALKKSSDNLLYLVNTILDYNKLQAGKTELDQIHFNLSEYIRHVDISSRMIAMEHGIHWELTVDTSLPEIVQGDMARVNQIMNNLIHNAIKFTPQGSIRLDVRLQARVNDTAYVAFEITDSGIGISAEKLEKIFTPFYQVHVRGYENSAGTGLGLAIVKGLVDLLNGRITVESVLGKGSVFKVEIPLRIPPSHELDIVKKEPAVDVVLRLKGSSVLYAEDVESNRFVIENLLSDMGLQITTVSSGEEALLLTDKFSYHVILMDLHMPGMDGYHTAEAIQRQVRGKNKNTPIIAFTAKSYNEELKIELAKHHFHDVIIKPFNTDVLLEKIANARIASSAPQGRSNKIITFTFYEVALRYNKEKLSAVKNELLRNAEQLEEGITRISDESALSGISDIIHRLRPIARNLECEPLWVLLDDYQMHIQQGKELWELNKKIVPVLQLFKKALNELPYD